MTELDEILAARGFAPRAAQVRLYEHLTHVDHTGVVAQAGTGTGKSMAILAAAANHARRSGEQSIVVTPTLTLMNQYRDGDTPWAEKAFADLFFAEVRGMRHYQCEMSGGPSLDDLLEEGGLKKVALEDAPVGCLGYEAGCSQKGWEGHSDGCEEGCETLHGPRWHCGYRQARYDARMADVVVTNADMLIVNDRILHDLGSNFLSLDGSLFVDEAHTLEQKLRDYASRSLWHDKLRRFRLRKDEAVRIADWVERQERNLALKDTRGFPYDALLEISRTQVFPAKPSDSPKEKAAAKRDMEIQEACQRLQTYIEDPHDNAVLHVNSGSLRMDWINVAKSAAELITQRNFGLVSATVPGTMAATLGIADAPFTDVGHPFDYGSQAWLGFSSYAGDYKSAQHDANFDMRVNEVMDMIRRSKGGALVLFSSFKDLERVSDRLTPVIRRELGVSVMAQEREMEPAERQAMAEAFKADGNAVLFGSESFATGFDVPGDALRLVVIWKLPYPAVDPVSNAIRSQSFPRYNDIMKVRAVQAMGRLIRTDTDRGIVWVADNRGRRLIDPTDPLTAHIPQFARL